MKKLIFGFIMCIIVLSCGQQVSCPKEYSFQVQFLSHGVPAKNLDTIKYIGYGENKFFLEYGNLMHYDGAAHNHTAIAYGVVWFKTISIVNLTNKQPVEIK